MYTTSKIGMRIHKINESFLLFGCNGEVNHSIPESESISLSFMYIIMISISTFGNTLVILGILKNKQLRFPRNYLLCSLAFIDLLSPIIRLLSIAISTMKGKWIFGCVWCRISSTTGVFFCSASILHLCVITLERYICVRYPLRSKIWITKRRTLFALAFIWFLALMMALIPYLTSTVDLYFNHLVLFCDFYLVQHPILSLLMTFLYFCFPLGLMVLVYYLIYRKTVLNNKRMSTFDINSRRTKHDVKRRLKQEWKTVKMCIVVIGMFFLLWLPYFSVACIKSYYPNFVAAWIQRAALTFAYLNSCVNFIVYSIMNKKLRSAFKEFLPCVKNIKGDMDLSIITQMRCATILGIKTRRNTCDQSTNESFVDKRSRQGTMFSDISNSMEREELDETRLNELGISSPIEVRDDEMDDIISDQSSYERTKSDSSIESPTCSLNMMVGSETKSIIENSQC